MQTIEPVTQETTNLLQNIRSLVKNDLSIVDELIINELLSNIPLIQQITHHIMASGGKRLRPLVVLLSAKALGYQSGNEHCELAAIIEFVHTATLLHDDVVDKSNLRRGQKTANSIWGNQASVLVGDFLYSRAFQLLTRRSNIPIMHALAKTTNAIAEGEVLQLMNRNNPNVNEASYMNVIHHKTAKLFESSAEIGAILGNKNARLQKAAAQYGLHLGFAFQIVDDILDYTADATVMGKNVGDDLAEGKATLPLIYALHHASPIQAKQIYQAIEKGGLKELKVVLQAIKETRACEYSFNKAREHAEQARLALEWLPDTPFRESMSDLITFVVNRDF